jgi:hypothetical protein
MIAHIVELLNSVTAHPDDGQKWPKHVGSMKRGGGGNIYIYTVEPLITDTLINEHLQ